MDCSLPGSSVHGTFQARVLEWGATAFSEKYANERETLNRSLQDKAEEILIMILNEKSTIQSYRQTMIITLYIKYARYHILENNLIRRE